MELNVKYEVECMHQNESIIVALEVGNSVFETFKPYISV